MKPEVTVLIPSYNAGAYLIKALDSVLLQTYPHWETIIIDDASTDDSIANIGGYIDHRQVRLVRNEHNIGQSKSMNVGLSMVQTPYVVQLDADDWFYPGTLEAMVAEARQQDERVGLISGNINVVFEDENGNNSGGGFIMKNRSFQDKYDFLLANLSQWPRFYVTSALRSIGGWPADDPYEGRYLEDKRVLMRLIEQYHFHWMDRLLYNHRRHARNQTLEIEKYNEITEWNIRDALQRWGDAYEPIFEVNSIGWKVITGLKPR